MPDTDPKFITRANASLSIKECNAVLFVSQDKYDFGTGEVIGTLTNEELQEELKKRKGQGFFRLSAHIHDEYIGFQSPHFLRSNPAEREAAFREIMSNAGTVLFKKLTQ